MIAESVPIQAMVAWLLVPSKLRLVQQAAVAKVRSESTLQVVVKRSSTPAKK